MGDLKRGRCAECDRSITLTKAGVMRDHVGDVWISGYRQQCKGVGQPPVEVLVSDFDRGYRHAIAVLRHQAEVCVAKHRPVEAKDLRAVADFLESRLAGEQS
ncbi:MAG TPA: hypothetical protein VF174_08965 [Micromonosporaceae bacterium]